VGKACHGGQKQGRINPEILNFNVQRNHSQNSFPFFFVSGTVVPLPVSLSEWRRHSSFYFQLEPAVILDNNHDGRGFASFGATFPLSQLGHFGSFFSSSYTRNARLQSLHSYSLPGISLTPWALSSIRTYYTTFIVCCPGPLSH
jgi:hypothetical protein